MDFLKSLWSEEKARPPLILLASIVALCLLWVVFGGAGSVDIEEKPELYSEVVVQGRVEPGSGTGSLDSSRPMTVHLSVPEIAYQQDVTLVPDENGEFEIPLKLPTEKQHYSFDLDLSQGNTRWRARSGQSLDITQSTLEVAELTLTPPPDRPDPRTHLKAQPAADTEALQQLRADRRKRREDRMQKRRERRGRTKGQ